MRLKQRCGILFSCRVIERTGNCCVKLCYLNLLRFHRIIEIPVEVCENEKLLYKNYVI